ncbi:AbrB/MazE/SpoVT family DNA-binding domain-containing protein [Pseudonocardia spinosispora]|uniref:AbrB/MazE/SpoVT family DNA-binding domain-containing protein n=1 Tax=Pseudonocardia spinosispora TaxID=103441 RepID=UPI000428829E|nr:AbrB/MazE/SpoVT family DNA-binding domain-containing protein [Pseudonocardia spinosispora]
MDTHIGFAAIQPKNGTVTIPAQLRRRFGLDQPGAQVEIVERDGQIVLIPYAAVPVDQRWFWTPEWQAMEREADEEIAAGQGTTFDTGEELLAHFDKVIESGADEA